MTEYLTPSQRAELEAQLNAPYSASNGEEPQQAIQDGMTTAQSNVSAQEDERLLQENGFRSVADLLDAYKQCSAAVNDLREILNQWLDLNKAAENAAQLDTSNGEYALHQRLEVELEPLREQARSAARNRLIQKDWQDSAAEMPDLESLLPEMAEYILSHPRFSGESDGLRRAYDAVRSARYRDEEALLADPAFIERVSGNERVRSAVLKAHLEKIMRGTQPPQSIGAGSSRGVTPVSGQKPADGMAVAKARLNALLGAKP